MWKPKSESPEHNGEYIVTMASKEVTLCIFSAKSGWDLKGVIAWMDKPDPFIPDEEVLAAVMSGAPLVEEEEEEDDFLHYLYVKREVLIPE